jgi:hypothetical protein
VLLARPQPPRVETVNDLDCYLANFWRALQHDPDGVAYWADWPGQRGRSARTAPLARDARRPAASSRVLTVDPHYFDVKIAGWWVWGQCLWIGSGWTRPERAAWRAITRCERALASEAVSEIWAWASSAQRTADAERRDTIRAAGEATAR